MSERYWRRTNAETGASAVEFAIVLPLLVVLVFGIIQFSIGFTRIQGLNAAAREAGRVAALARDVTEAEIEQRARDAAPPFIDPAHLVVAICDDEAETCASGGNWCQDMETNPRVRVEVSIEPAQQARYSITVPFIRDFGGDLRANGVFRCEAARSAP